MGILDDAIREHLDLKRRLGAEDGELARLEDEAFGPPSRPGDPDFPASRRRPAAAAAVAEPATGETRRRSRSVDRGAVGGAGEAPQHSPSRRAPNRLSKQHLPPRSRIRAICPAATASSTRRRRPSRLRDRRTWSPPTEPVEPEAATRAAAASEPAASRASRSTPRSSAQCPTTAEPSPGRRAARRRPRRPRSRRSSRWTRSSTTSRSAIEDTGEAEVVEGELADEPEAGRGGGRGRARGDAGVPTRTRGRRALVRAGRAEGLRLLGGDSRRSSASRS